MADPSLDEMMGDLAAADAAGDTQLAQHIAGRIKSLQTPVAPAQPNVSGLTAFGRGAAQGATLGLGERIMGGIQAALPVPGDPSSFRERYRQQLAAAQAESDKAQKAHPAAYIAGNVVGGAAPTVLLPTAKAAQGASLATRMGVGALNAAPVGAMIGGAESRQTTPLGVLRDVLKGGAGGALAGGAMPVLGKAIEAAGKGAAGAADWAAIRSAFPDRTVFKRVFGKPADVGDVRDVGRFALESGIPLHSPQAMLEGAQGIMQSSGQEIGNLAKQAGANGAKFDLEGAALKALQSPKIQALSQDTEGRPLYDRVASFLDDQVTHKGNTIDPVEAHALRRRVDDLAKWEKDKPADLIDAWRSVRGALNDEMTNTMQRGGVGNQWAQANDAFSKAASIRDLAATGAEKRHANRFISPYEAIAGTVGSVSAAAGHPAGLTVPAAMWLGNRYGMPVLARTLQAAGNLAGQSVPRASTGAAAGLSPYAAQLLTRVLGRSGLTPAFGGEKETQP